MSDYLPFEIQVEIIKRLPVKSLIRFRSVCKSWKSLIQRSDFIADYSSQMQHLLVRYTDAPNFNQKCFSIVDDDTFPHHKVTVTIPLLVQKLKRSKTVGSSHGLLCLYGYLQEGRDVTVSETKTVVLWNPSIRKAVSVDVPNVINDAPSFTSPMYGTILGFGVCNENNDHKIVKINHINKWMDMESIGCIPWQVEVFTLSTGVWRPPNNNLNLPSKSIKFGWEQVVVDRFLYWLAADRIIVNGEFRFYPLIISFDLTTEEFDVVNIPDISARRVENKLSMSKIRESLVLVHRVLVGSNMGFDVWMMDNGVQKLFTKLYTVDIPGTCVTFAREFRESGEPLIEILQMQVMPFRPLGSLAAYDPYSKSINDFDVIGEYSSFSVHSYVETLLLL